MVGATAVCIVLLGVLVVQHGLYCFDKADSCWRFDRLVELVCIHSCIVRGVHMPAESTVQLAEICWGKRKRPTLSILDSGSRTQY
jgi:hypothetical protein